MAQRGRRAELTRYGAAAAFLLAVTVAVLLVRAGLEASGREPTTTAPPTAPTTRPSPPQERVYYRVRRGDTLEAVAFRYDTSVEDLLALNPGIDPNSLRIGQRLRVK